MQLQRRLIFNYLFFQSSIRPLSSTSSSSIAPRNFSAALTSTALVELSLIDILPPPPTRVPCLLKFAMDPLLLPAPIASLAPSVPYLERGLASAAPLLKSQLKLRPLFSVSQPATLMLYLRLFELWSIVPPPDLEASLGRLKFQLFLTVLRFDYMFELTQLFGPGVTFFIRLLEFMLEISPSFTATGSLSKTIYPSLS